MSCKNCNSKSLKKVVELNSQPISSIFYNSKKKILKKYNIDLYKCLKCHLIQFLKVIPVDKMYGTTYGYQSGISNLMVNHLKEKYNFLRKKKIIDKKSIILDIGSNDGTFLNFFSKKNILIGVDPSLKKFEKNYNKHIHKINNFFSETNINNFFLKNNIKKKKFNLISSIAMFYDIPNPNTFCKNIYENLDTNGVWLCEFSYLPLMLKNLTYDQICHEHVTYYNLTVFKSIIEKNNLKLIDIRINEINGGSIEVLCTRTDSSRKEKKFKITNILKDEKKIMLKSFTNFNYRIDKAKNDLNNFFNENITKKIIGYGASTKGNIILNHCNINNKILPYICDASKEKIGKFTPGSNIKIISKTKMRKLNPNYLLVLIWPFRKEVIKQEINYIKQGGQLIFHLPKLHIINKYNYKDYLRKNIKFTSFKY
jgi:hypothetical protein